MKLSRTEVCFTEKQRLSTEAKAILLLSFEKKLTLLCLVNSPVYINYWEKKTIMAASLTYPATMLCSVKIYSSMNKSATIARTQSSQSELQN